MREIWVVQKPARFEPSTTTTIAQEKNWWCYGGFRCVSSSLPAGSPRWGTTINVEVPEVPKVGSKKSPSWSGCLWALVVVVKSRREAALHHNNKRPQRSTRTPTLSTSNFWNFWNFHINGGAGATAVASRQPLEHWRHPPLPRSLWYPGVSPPAQPTLNTACTFPQKVYLVFKANSVGGTRPLRPVAHA